MSLKMELIWRLGSNKAYDLPEKPASGKICNIKLLADREGAGL
jgi:hypothetical protein